MKNWLTRPLADEGLLILRIGLGVMFMVHGWPKISGGPEKWLALGEAMNHLGISFAPAFWGFMAAFAEFFGGLLLLVGLLARPATFLLAFTMLVATVMHLKSGHDFVPKVSYPLELMIVFLGLLLLGPGRISLDHKLFGLPPARKD